MSPSIELPTFLAELDDLSLRPITTWGKSDYSLDRMRALMEALGQPQQNYPSIHVAGTNGKGSVCALASAALLAQGHRVGRYTSPHLAGPLAGIHLDAEPATAEQLAEAWKVLALQLGDLGGMTVFEVVTALAFLVFAHQAVDVAVIEVGLGGRLDATNVIVPTVSVITPLDLEHTHILGDSLAAIAAEKGGIIKAGVPLVLSPQPPEAAEVLRQLASGHAVPVEAVGDTLMVQRLAFDSRGQRIRLWRPDSPDQTFETDLGLLGAHQAGNAAAAYAALQQLERAGLQVSAEAIQQGFAAAHWPGRMEVLDRDPLILLDGAHTPAAARALAEALEDHFPGRPVHGLLGVSEDKTLAALLQPLENRIARLWVTQSAHPRGLPWQTLADALEQTSVLLAGAGPLAEVLPAAQQAARKAGALLLIFGSVFLVEQARGLLR